MYKNFLLRSALRLALASRAARFLSFLSAIRLARARAFSSRLARLRSAYKDLY